MDKSRIDYKRADDMIKTSYPKNYNILQIALEEADDDRFEDAIDTVEGGRKYTKKRKNKNKNKKKKKK